MLLFFSSSCLFAEQKMMHKGKVRRDEEATDEMEKRTGERQETTNWLVPTEEHLNDSERRLISFQKNMHSDLKLANIFWNIDIDPNLFVAIHQKLHLLLFVMNFSFIQMTKNYPPPPPPLLSVPLPPQFISSPSPMSPFPLKLFPLPSTPHQKNYNLRGYFLFYFLNIYFLFYPNLSFALNHFKNFDKKSIYIYKYWCIQNK